jgi:arylsulfatase B
MFRGLAALLTLSTVTGSSPPHLVVIAVDDWGWNNLGVHGKETNSSDYVVTPRMDELISEGILLERHYVFRFCSPSRSALNTGRNPIHINVLNSDLTLVNEADPVSGFAGLPRNVTALPAMLAKVGYSTVHAGKW